MDISQPSRMPLPEHALDAILDIWRQTDGCYLIPIRGTSMLPLLQEGDRIQVEFGYRLLRRGDIVVFRDSGRIVAHRILRLHNGMILAKGDNNFNPDSPIRFDQLVGRVVAVHRGDRARSLDTPLWHLIGWLLAMGALAWQSLYHVGRSYKQSLFGAKPNRLFVILLHLAHLVFFTSRKIIRASLCR